MAPSPLPAALAHIEGVRNHAADTALVEALPRLEPAAQAEALSILSRRTSVQALSILVHRFDQYDDRLRGLIVARARDWGPGLRAALVSSDYRHRTNAIDLVVDSDAADLCYLLADGLRSRCRRTRQRSAAGLRAMTTRLVDRAASGGQADDVAAVDAAASHLGEALSLAIRRWETHLEPDTIEAALFFAGRVDQAVFNKLREPRSGFAQALNRRLECPSDVRMAGFVVRALGMPELRAAAGRGITSATNRSFVRAVLTQAWLVADPRIESGCRWIRGADWFAEALDVLGQMEVRDRPAAVRFLAATGGTPAEKRRNYLELIAEDDVEVRRATRWALTHDRGPHATEVLSIVALRSGDELAGYAACEVRRRSASDDPDVALPATTAPLREAFSVYWTGFDAMHPAERREAAGLLRGSRPAIDTFLRAKLSSREPLDRVRALRMASNLGLEHDLEPSVHRCVRDSDGLVRAAAVAMLAEVPGPAPDRMLEAALHDGDPRVVANSIEVMDRLEVKQRATLTEPALRSTDCRVRGNAIKSLLRLERPQAGEALLDMFEDPAPSHRMAALWLVDRLSLVSLRGRLEDIGRDDPVRRVRRRAEAVATNLARRSLDPPRVPTSRAVSRGDRVWA